MFTCVICGKELSRRQRLIGHYTSKTSGCKEGLIKDTINCTDRDREEFGISSALVVSKSKPHDSNYKTTVSSEVTQMTTSESVFSCPICGKMFSKKSNLVRHQNKNCKNLSVNLNPYTGTQTKPVKPVKIENINSNNEISATIDNKTLTNNSNNMSTVNQHRTEYNTGNKTINETNSRNTTVTGDNNNIVTNSNVVNIGHINFNLDVNQAMECVRMKSPEGELEYLQRIIIDRYFKQGQFPVGCTDPVKNKFYYFSDDQIRHTTGQILAHRLCKRLKIHLTRANNNYHGITEKPVAPVEISSKRTAYPDEYFRNTVKIANIHLHERKIGQNLKEILNVNNYDGELLPFEVSQKINK